MMCPELREYLSMIRVAATLPAMRPCTRARVPTMTRTATEAFRYTWPPECPEKAWHEGARAAIALSGGAEEYFAAVVRVAGAYRVADELASAQRNAWLDQRLEPLSAEDRAVIARATALVSSIADS
jgi:hypothetical protein